MITVTASIALAMFVAAGCGRDREPPAEHEARPVVAVTIFPIAELVREIAGPAADVVTVLPPGARPHTFEPSPGLVRRLVPSRLVVAVGASLDGWADGLARGAGIRRLTVTDGMTLVDGNPHVWLAVASGARAPAARSRPGDGVRSDDLGA